MTVRFISNAYIPHSQHTVFGEPFPTPEIQALWNMIEVDIAVLWIRATNTFILQRLDAPRRFGRTSTEPCIAAAHAGYYDDWVAAIEKLL